MHQNDTSPVNQNGWNEWSRYVLKELERMSSCYAALDKRYAQLHEDIVILKVKAAAIAVGASVITTVGIMILNNVLGK